MTPDDILRMASEADLIDFRDAPTDPYIQDLKEPLRQFAAMVAAAEREECATLAERATARKRTLHKMANNLPELPPCAIAAAIRARGKT